MGPGEILDTGSSDDLGSVTSPTCLRRLRAKEGDATKVGGGSRVERIKRKR